MGTRSILRRLNEAAYDVAKKRQEMDRLIVAVLVNCAEELLPLWRASHLRDTSPQEAIACAKAWVADPTQENARAAYRAAGRVGQCRKRMWDLSQQDWDEAMSAADAAYNAANAASTYGGGYLPRGSVA